MDTAKNKYSILISLDIGLALLTFLSGLLFYTLIQDDGYQLYYAFLLIPLLTLGQVFKIYFLLISKNPTILFLLAILMTFIYYIPLSDSWTHDIKITYPLSAIVYFSLTIFLVTEVYYFSRQNKIAKTNKISADT